MEGYCVALSKPTRKWIPSLRYYVIKHHRFILLEGYCSSSKQHNTPTMPLIAYPRNTLGPITWNVEGYCIALPKPTNKTIPCLRYPRNTLGSKTYILKLVRILHNHIKKPMLLRYSIIKHHRFTLLERYCSCSKLHNTLIIPLIWFPKNTLGP
jgi:hypothetical protein